MSAFKQAVSVLVLVHTPAHEILLLERARQPGYWQSVTGSREDDETPVQTACRELLEETGLRAPEGGLRDWRVINNFEIFPQWRARYAPGVTHNREQVFSLCLPAPCPITLAAQEHRAFCWLPARAAADACFSWSNRDAIHMLAQGAG